MQTALCFLASLCDRAKNGEISTCPQLVRGRKGVVFVSVMVVVTLADFSGAGGTGSCEVLEITVKLRPLWLP